VRGNPFRYWSGVDTYFRHCNVSKSTDSLRSHFRIGGRFSDVGKRSFLPDILGGATPFRRSGIDVLLFLIRIVSLPFGLCCRSRAALNYVSFRTISLPVSSTIFNRILRHQVEPLDIPLLLKELVLSDPTTAQSVVPAEYRQIILESLVYSIRKAFLLGIVCSILCALSFYLVPWLPLTSSPEAQQGGPTKAPDLPLVLPFISPTHDPETLNCP
jgi:hypothetical protein